MKLDGFKLEVYFEQYEFTAPYLLCCSDCESMTVNELLAFEPGAKEAFLDGWLGYTESPGDAGVLEEVAKLYTTVKPENVLEHVGAQEAIYNFTMSMLQPGDHMVSMFPIYSSSYEVAEAMGCEVSRWELYQTGEGWKIDIDKLEPLIKPNTKVIAVNTPNNPTGYVLSREEMEAIAEIARKHNLIIFSDEVYAGLGDAPLPPAFVDVYENAVSLNVLSKAYGLSGLRLGWIATRNMEIRKKMGRYKHYTTICSPAPSQFLARIGLKHRDAIIKRNAAIINENLAYGEAFFDRHKDLFLYNRPMGGSVAFHKLLSDQSITTFSKEAVDSKGVLLLPDYIYDFNGNYFRFGYGRKGFKESLNKFEEFLSERK